MKILSAFLIFFVYLYFFGFHENLKNKNTRDHSEHVLHRSIASDCYISIILHHTVASSTHQHSISSDYCISIILHQAYCISLMYHQPSHHLISHCQEYGGSARFSAQWSDSVHMYLWNCNVIQTNYPYWVLIINAVSHHLTCLR